MNAKEHYKLYKSGKRLVTALIATAAIIEGLAFAKGSVVHADDTQINTTYSTSYQETDSQSEKQTSSVQSDNSQNEQESADTNNEQALFDVNNQGISSNNNLTSMKTNNTQEAQNVQQSSTVQNGWKKTANGKMAYYQNGELLHGRQYVSLPTIPGTTNDQNSTNYYLMDNGIAQSKVQQWAGTYYYFDPVTYLRVDNNYVQSQWNDWYMFGPDGRIVTGLWNWMGSTYYFDPVTYLRVNNDYRQAQNGNWYMFGPDGRIVSGVYPWAGSYYYFDPVTHLRVDNDYRQSQWGDWYLFGNDGRVLSGVQRWAGSYYYFDPTTYLRVDDEYITSQWGSKYMTGKDGRIVSGLYKWDKTGNWYYFDPNTYLAVTNNYIQANDGHWYLFTTDGTAASGVAKWMGTYYYFDPVTHLRVDNNYVQSQWGDWYMFGPDGRIVTGLWNWMGSTYYFDPITYLKVTNKWVDGKYYGADGAQVRNNFVFQNGKLYYFDNNGAPLQSQSKTINGITFNFDENGVATNFTAFRDGIAEQVARMIKQQNNGDVLFDWTNQTHNYKEYSVHEMAQLLAQGDADNNANLIQELLKKNSLFTGTVVKSDVFDLDNTDYNTALSQFVTEVAGDKLDGDVLGVGLDPSQMKLALLLIKPENESLATTTENAQSTIKATVEDVYKHSGVIVDVNNGLQKNQTVDSSDTGDLTTGITTLLTGPKGKEISQDVLEAIYASLPGNSSALIGIKNYKNGNDNYHYEYWLEGQSANDKLNNFLSANKNVKYGDPIVVNYSATLTYGDAKTTSDDITTDKQPASEKSADQINLAYETGSETGLQYDKVKIEPVQGVTNDMIRGVDISSYEALLNAGVQFYDFSGKPANLFKVLSDAGVNWVRIRVWNDPFNKDGKTYSGGDNTEENLVKMASEASKYGMKVLVDFQYSDFWTDPAQQILPKAWKNLSNEEIETEVNLYTAKVLNDLRNAGANVGMVQIGNEITNGAFGLYTGRNGGGDWSSLWKTSEGDQVAKDIEAGSRAVRAFDPNVKIAIQLETPEIEKYRGIMTVLKNNNVDYDYLGTSYYPFWSAKQGNKWYDSVDLGYGASTPINLEAIEKMAQNEFGKRVVVLETGWLNNTNDADGTHNSVGGNTSTTNIDAYSVDPQGQVNEMTDLYKALVKGNGVGAFYWEPAWIPVKAGWDNWQYNRAMSNIYGSGWASKYAVGYAPDSVLDYNGQPAWGGSSWDNVSLFDDHGHPLQSLNIFKGLLNGYQSPEVVTKTSTLKIEVAKVWNNTDVTPNDNDVKENTQISADDFADNSNISKFLKGDRSEAISSDNLQAIAKALTDGVKSKEYTAANGATYHYVFWLDGNNSDSKIQNFVTANSGKKYGDTLLADYSATVYVDSEPETKPVENVETPLVVKVGDVYNSVNGTKINISNPLQTDDQLSSIDVDLTTLDSTQITNLLRGPKNTSIDSATLTQLQNLLPGKSSGWSGLKDYKTSDGNHYRYQFWLKSIDWSAKYGEPLVITYTASLKWQSKD